jgi:hypothetical protein
VNDNASLRAGAASFRDDSIPINANSAHSGGKLEIHYAKANTSKTLRKPLIIAEPFDMSSILSVFPDYTLNKIFEDSRIQPVRAMIDSLQYDIVYVNYNNGLDDIFRNAALFKEAIRKVNQLKDKSVNHPNLVLGISMGGLVARYALRSMEIAGEDHNTWKYISIDSPHKGANLPLGLQGLIRDIEGLSISIFGSDVLAASHIIPILDELYGVLDAKATRQMLIYYCDKNMNIDNSEHENFQKEYDRVGFPLKCQNIAVSCGSAGGNALFAPGTRLFTWNPSKHFNALESFGIEIGAILASMLYVKVGDLPAYKIALQNLFIGNSVLKADFYVDALPDKKVAKVFDGHIYFRKWILGFIRVTTNISHKELYSKEYMLPLDGAAGSFNSFTGVPDNNADFNEILASFKKREFTFIPTPSSLAISNWQDFTARDIRSRDLYAEGLTEFEYNCSPDFNYQHCDIAFAATFLAQHLAAPPILFDLASTGFNTSVRIPLKNPQNASVSWSSSNSYFSFTDKTNTSATLFCEKSKQAGIITVSNTVTVPPAMASALGVSGSFRMQQRKRMNSLSEIKIDGSFNSKNPFATLRIFALPAGIPVSWKLSDNANFRVLSSAADSAVIEALSYNKTTTATATVSLQGGKQASVQTQLISPRLSFSVPLLNCRETEIAFAPMLSSFESVEWSTNKYIKIIGSKNNVTVKVSGVQNTGGINSPKGKVKAMVKVKGEIVGWTEPATVVIPEGLYLSVRKIWRKGDATSPSTNHNVVLVHASVIPYSSDGISYQWSTTNGYIRPCVPAVSEVARLETGDIKTLFNNNAQTAINQISRQDLTPALLQTILAEVAEEEEEDIAEENIVITRSATSTSSTGKVEAVVLGISKVNTPSTNTLAGNTALAEQSTGANLLDNSLTTVQSPDKYVLLSNPDSYLDPIHPTDPIDPELIVEIPTNDPSYAVLCYSGGDVTVRCNLKSPCNETLTASVFISGANFSCSYTSGNRSITISNDDTGGNNSGNGGTSSNNNYDNSYWINPETGECYKIYIYNDYGLIEVVDIDSSIKKLDIPMYGYPNGFYYVNIVDSQGNVVTRQTVQVQ